MAYEKSLTISTKKECIKDRCRKMVVKSIDHMTACQLISKRQGAARTAATAFCLDRRVRVFSFLQRSPDRWNLVVSYRSIE
jgi:hypothetical protein